MPSQETVTTKKKRGPAPTGKGEPVGVRLHRDLLGALDSWIASQSDPKPTRPEAIRIFLRTALLGSEAKG